MLKNRSVTKTSHLGFHRYHQSSKTVHHQLQRRNYATCLSDTFTGAKALQVNEPLLFEQGCDGLSGVDLPPFEPPETNMLGEASRDPQDRIGLPGLSEFQVMRHYIRLSQKNYNIDSGMYPLGSCTMKYNPRVNETVARFPGFSRVHPLQPPSTVQGTLEAMHTLAEWLIGLTGMKSVAMTPAAGAHGELCGMMAISQALKSRGEKNREIVLIPRSAHGTNPASAVMAGFKSEYMPSRPDGRVDVDQLRRDLESKGSKVAAAMITNPNTHGMFEKDIIEVAEILHENGAYLYCDGANFNALLGRVRIADLGVDCMHINLHKTFSTPHGGGGPGSGPVVLAESLANFAPVPYVLKDGESFRLVETDETGHSLGRIRAFDGQMGMFSRALAYCMAYGAEGLQQVSGDAVLNANYLLARLQDVLTPAFNGNRCMHECLFSDTFLKGTGISTLDLAKALIDEGFHPPTVYWPLTVHGAMLIEPTETESKQSLDEYADALIDLVKRAKEKPVEAFKEAPKYAPTRRADETRAARQPVLRYTSNIV
eukprot:gb/GECH01011613.1/.p1 GENE.gb/GECH01011613.1/~~gb/GECH01011613.1/.p1  ORF type:complete len:540 (+),score=102.29 gb/GECH01011613.1/:1-1620(+)